jgi:hypothetical protein
MLRWGGLMIAVLAIVAGILGMHVTSGAPAVPMAHANMDSAATDSAPTMMRPPATSTTSTSLGAADEPSEASRATHVPAPAPASIVCGCTPSACAADMAMHGSCELSLGGAALNAPQPGTITWLVAPASRASAAGYKSADRRRDPPSLEQLSISRT